MKISKFPLFSLALLGGAGIYALGFCKFDIAKILLDNTCKTFIQETMTTFLNDFEQAKEYKVSEVISDEALQQFQAVFQNELGHCELQNISMLKKFQVNSSRILKAYVVTLDCEKRKDVPLVVTVQQKGQDVKYFGLH